MRIYTLITVGPYKQYRGSPKSQVYFRILDLRAKALHLFDEHKQKTKVVRFLNPHKYAADKRMKLSAGYGTGTHVNVCKSMPREHYNNIVF